ncbi:Monooxygenase 3 [Linum grandiflorum]
MGSEAVRRPPLHLGDSEQLHPRCLALKKKGVKPSISTPSSKKPGERFGVASVEAIWREVAVAISPERLLHLLWGIRSGPAPTRGGEGPRPVHRKVLLEALAAELPAESIRFSSHITSIETQQLPGGAASLAVVHLKDGTTIKSKVLIGCDGLHSLVAQWLGLSAPIHSGRSAVRGLSVYPNGHGFKHKVEQFIDVGKRGGLVPLNDTELFWFLTCQGDHRTYDPMTIQKEVLEKHVPNFPTFYKDVVRNSDLSSLSWAPLMLRNPWNIIVGNLSKGNITVAGDAMHPMTPDLGQGGCCALEDAVVLGRHIGNAFLRNGKSLVPEEMASVLDGYVKERRWRAAGLVTGSYVSGWVQQSGQNWWRKLLRVFFYSYLLVALARLIRYNCGKLPQVVDDSKSDGSSKLD